MCLLNQGRISLFKTDETILLTEVPTSWGVVDVLAIKVKKSVLKQRRNIVNIGSNLCFTTIAAYAISYLKSYGNLTAQELGDHLKIRNGILADTIQILVERGIVHQCKNGKISLKSTKDILAISQVITFEAKLKNWRKAIEQAERHLWFANESYIIIPKPSTDLLINVNKECMKRNIGLVLQNDDGRFEISRVPSNQEKIESYLLWKFNENLIDGSFAIE